MALLKHFRALFDVYVDGQLEVLNLDLDPSDSESAE
jgi:hypothetical protein